MVIQLECKSNRKIMGNIKRRLGKYFYKVLKIWKDSLLDWVNGDSGELIGSLPETIEEIVIVKGAKTKNKNVQYSSLKSAFINKCFVCIKNISVFLFIIRYKTFKLKPSFFSNIELIYC